MRRVVVCLLVVLALIGAACGGDAESEQTARPDDPEPAGEVTDTASDATGGSDGADEASVGDAEPSDDDVAAISLPDYEEQAAGFAQAARDRDLPPVTPESPIGAYGYSRYVFTQSAGEIVPTLIEGPLGLQVRCQQEAQDCSYQELKALYEGGGEVPSYLGMDRETLGELVGQLDRVNAAINQYPTIDDACAAGFSKSTNQVANMGIHMIDGGAVGFDPDRPQMVLFASEDGAGLKRDELGTCRGGEWTGADGFEPVGAVFNINLTADHPDGFAGPIDNWHIHYNTCIGRTTQSGADDPNASAEGSRSSTTRALCESQGGNFLEVIPSWMMHAYVAEDYDAQSGVFSMFNPTIWPLANADDLVASRTVDTADAQDAPIINFDFGEINVDIGETVRFSNSDSVPHTVTAGSSFEPSDEFDSGILGTGQAYDLAFDEAGEYELFCALHPDMTGTVVVG